LLRTFLVRIGRRPEFSPGEGASLQEVTVGVEAALRMIVRIASVAKKAAETQRALEIEVKQEVFDEVVRTIVSAFEYANRFDTPEERQEAFRNRLSILAVTARGEGDQAEGGHLSLAAMSMLVSSRS